MLPSKIAEQAEDFDELLDMVKKFSDEVFQAIARRNSTAGGKEPVTDSEDIPDFKRRQGGALQDTVKVCLATVKPR